MRVYIDTSVLVAALAGESHAQAILQWRREKAPQLLTAEWTIAEFSSALSIKERTGQLTGQQANAIWEAFEYLIASDLHILPLARELFDAAAKIMRHGGNCLRAGDALHLVLASNTKIPHFATLDKLQGKQAESMGLQVVTF